MNDQSNTSQPTPRKVLKPRRLALLASVAGLSMAVLAIGPSGYLPFNIPGLTSQYRFERDAGRPFSANGARADLTVTAGVT